MNGPFDLPESWCWATLGDVAAIGGGLTLNKSIRGASTELVPLVTVAAVRLRAIDKAGVRQVGLLPEDGDKGVLLHEDLLVVEGNGSLDHIGRVAMWDGSIPGARHQNHLIRVRPIQIVPRYMLEWLASPYGRDLLVETASTTAGLYNLSLAKLAAILIPVAPANEQRRIAAKLEVLYDRIKAVRTILSGVVGQTVSSVESDLSELERAILAKAFRGELVEQDPNDEPASALLERIRAGGTSSNGSVRKARRNRT